MLAPEFVGWALVIGNRNFIIHEYDEINRAITWQTLFVDLPEWKASLAPLFQAADVTVEAGSDDDVGSR